MIQSLKFIILFIFLIFKGVVSSYAQEDDINNLFVRAQLLIHHNPDESIKISDYLSDRNLSLNDQNKVKLIKSQSYIVKNDLNSAVITVFDIKSNFAEINFEAHLLKAKLAKELYLDNQFFYYINLAETSIKKEHFSDEQDKNTLLNILKAEYYIERQKFEELHEIIGTKLKNTISKTTNVDTEDYVTFLSLHTDKNKTDKVKVIESLIRNQQEQKYPNKLYLIKYNLELGKYFFSKNNFKNAIESFQNAIEIAEQLNNTAFIQTLNYEISLCYLTIQDIQNYNEYNKVFLSYNNTIQDIETKIVNTYFSKYDTEIQDQINEDQRIYDQKLYWASIPIIFIFLIGLSFLIRKKNEEKKLKEIISYLERYNNPEKIKLKNDIPKRTSVSDDAEKMILKKLKKFESSKKYTQKEMSLASLAAQFDTNTKYLSEVINKHYGTNFNLYINTLRINFVIDKLRDNDEFLHYKISYLADISGFSSHSSFATVFKSITGIAPKTFIELLKKEPN